jgi:hypothetical protein
MIQFLYSIRREKIMKKIKALACVLAAAMLAGIFAGCSKTTKITADKFAKACEKLKLEEVDYDDGGLGDELEDGFYFVADEDDIEDEPETVEGLLNEVGLGDVIDTDDVKSIGFAAKCTGIDDLDGVEDPEDLEDVKVDGAFAVVIELEENYVGDVMDFVDDMLDTYYVNTKDLTNKEYYVSKNDGYTRLHIDVAKLAKIVQDNDDIMELIDAVYDEDDFKDLCKNLSGDVAITIEINGSNIFILGGVSINTKATTLNSFSSAFGASNPAKLPMNEKLVKGLVEDIFEDYGNLATSQYSGGYDDYDFDDYDYDFDDEDI